MNKSNWYKTLKSIHCILILFFSTNTIMESILPLILDWLTIGDLARLYHAMCDRSTISTEMSHVLRSRLYVVRPPSTQRTLVQTLSSHMIHSKTRCRECGTQCRRKSHVCYRCANDPHSFRSMVSRNDLRTTSDGWRIRERRLLQALSTIKVVSSTSTGAYLYWRREALQALM